MRCRTCDLAYPVRDGVFLLGPPFAATVTPRDAMAERMGRLADEATREGWDTALAKFTAEVLSGNLRAPAASRLEKLRAKLAGQTWEDTLADLVDPTRAGWKFLLDLNPADWVLFLGPSWGAAPLNVARGVAHVVVLDGALERLRIVRRQAEAAGLENLTLARVLDPLRLPLPDGSLSVAIVPGIAEWFTTAGGRPAPAGAVADLLQELRRVLTPSGQIYLGADNKRAFMRPLAASGVALPPRAIVDAARAAGFPHTELFAPVPFRHKFHQVLDVVRPGRMNFDLDVYRTRGRVVRPLVKIWDACNRDGALERRLYGVLPGLSAVVAGESRKWPVAERIFVELAAKRQIPPTARLGGYHVRAKGVVVLTGTGAVIRMPLDERAEAACARHHRALETCVEDGRIPANLRALFPAPLARGYFEGHTFFAESALAGESGRVYYARGARRYDAAITDAASVLCELRRATEVPTLIDEAEWQRLAGAWLTDLGRLVPETSRAGVAKLAEHLAGVLRGRTLPLGWHNGDYDFANLLYGADDRVGGVLDFEVFDPHGLPLIDLMVLLARRPIRKTGFAFGTLFARHILPRRLPRLEAALLERELRALDVDDELYQALALCCWLNHLRLRRDSWLVRSPAWLEANLHEVLDTVRRTL